MITLITTPANNIPYLFAAYGIAWAVFFGFAFLAWRRHHEMEREVRALREELRRRSKDGDTSAR